jgi:enoyl-CoA hydratase/3-hydroxyacyl-CoA dehydrogenase
MNFYKDENMGVIMSGKTPKGFEKDDKTVIRQMKLLSFTAPIALKIANQLLNDAITTGDDLDSGLRLELAELDTIFASKDALEGLSALIEGRRPKYIND